MIMFTSDLFETFPLATTSVHIVLRWKCKYRLIGMIQVDRATAPLLTDLPYLSYSCS